MIEKYPLHKCAKICEINLATAFAWRHKIRCLTKYDDYHNFVNFSKDSQDNKEVILLEFIRKTICYVRSADAAKRSAIPV